jgi:murein L,D-transpeptidase YcbB/YkuD
MATRTLPLRRAGLILACTLATGAAALSWGAPPTTAEVAQALRAVVTSEASTQTAATTLRIQRPALERFYGSRDYTPAWTDDGRPNREAEEAVELLDRAEEHGLVSADYEARNIRRKLVDLRGDNASSAYELAVFDVNLTLALVRYATHLAYGRLDRGGAYPDLETGAPRVDIVALLQRGRSDGRLTEEIESASPRLPIYDGLRQALAHYRRLAAEAPLPLVPVPKAKVAPGAVFAGLPQLKQRLVAFGDLDPSALKRRDGNRYSGPVVEAVRRFQYRHGLDEDGVLGQSTVADLNRSPIERVRQIEMAIERLRWLPPLPTGRYLVINIPEFRLRAFDNATSGDRTVLDMPVIVGRAGKTPTPLFADEVEYLDFSPYWNVPRSITVNEVLPKLRMDPGYLAREGMEVVGNGVRTEVDAATLSELQRGAVRLRQRPGSKNALGGVKFMFPNRYDVYLHSTPSQRLFGRTRRDFSHGCIRVADPVALAQFMLVDRPGWDVPRIRASMSLPQPVRVNIERSIPILIMYTTAAVDADGRIRFLPDIYDQDPKLARALADPARTRH